jgi:hypothetical protein
MATANPLARQTSDNGARVTARSPIVARQARSPVVARHARLAMKFLHTMGAIGLMGAMACFIVMLYGAPEAPLTAATLPAYATLRAAMAEIARWLFLPAMAATLISGLIAIAINRGFHNAGWAWVKLLSGVLIFEWGFVGIIGPLQNEAKLAARALAGGADAASLMASLGGETAAQRMSLWALFAVATFNVVFGVWRPRLTKLRD